MTEQVDRIMQSIKSSYGERGTPLEDMGGITVAVMGCNVNGPGEAKGADIGIAGGRGKTGTIFMKGSPYKTLPEENLLGEFEKLVKNLVEEKITTG
jgi:(E)-4-hydroxy-3-methylbut-2-enyl-diphosphate synthase